VSTYNIVGYEQDVYAHYNKQGFLEFTFISSSLIKQNNHLKFNKTQLQIFL